jgi:hypothetical protein
MESIRLPTRLAISGAVWNSSGSWSVRFPDLAQPVQLSNLIAQGFGAICQIIFPRRKVVPKSLQIGLHVVEKLKRHTRRQKLGNLRCSQRDFVRELRKMFFNYQGYLIVRQTGLDIAERLIGGLHFGGDFG